MTLQIDSGMRESDVPNISVQIQCHANDIPEYIADEIDLEYGALFASVLQLRLSEKLAGPVWSYIVLNSGGASTVLLFRIDGVVVKVLNEQMRMAAAAVVLFVARIFERFPGASRIEFFGIHTDRLALGYPCQRFFCAEDLVIPFFDTPDAFARHIGKSTRKNIRRHSTALALRHPCSRYEVLEGAAIDEQLVGRVISLNRARMARKHKASAYHDEDAQRLALLASSTGFAGVVTIAGKPIAISISCRVGDSYYMLMSGHEPAYDEFSLGLLCRYWSVMECIRRGASEVNLMGGRLDYKYWLLGQSRRYDRLEVYRSYRASLQHARTLIATAVRGQALETRFALLDCERKDSVAAHLVARAIRAWRTLKTEVL
jgi:hypothetical protein